MVTKSSLLKEVGPFRRKGYYTYRGMNIWPAGSVHVGVSRRSRTFWVVENPYIQQLPAHMRAGWAIPPDAFWVSVLEAAMAIDYAADAFRATCALMGSHHPSTLQEAYLAH